MLENVGMQRDNVCGYSCLISLLKHKHLVLTHVVLQHLIYLLIHGNLLLYTSIVFLLDFTGWILDCLNTKYMIIGLLWLGFTT